MQMTMDNETIQLKVVRLLGGYPNYKKEPQNLQICKKGNCCCVYAN